MMATTNKSNSNLIHYGFTVSQNKRVAGRNTFSDKRGTGYQKTNTYEGAFKAIITTDENENKILRVYDSSKSYLEDAGRMDPFGHIPYYDMQINEDDESFDLFILLYYDYEINDYAYQFSKSDELEGQKVVAVRICTWDAERNKLTQQWMFGDIILSYNYII